MKKIAIAVLVSIFAMLSFVPSADAGRRGNPGFNNGWNNNRGHGGHCGRHCGWHGGYWRGGYWGGGYWGGGYWGGAYYDPYVGYNDYCFIRKVRRYDQWGNAYIKRVRVCR
ncbi:hypothetical protein JJB09_00850 [Rhizobium sp. KVB221]|uniref:Sulfur globule protein n=1 Tax=Rhizobium setariae TaxID=2801340 RepID=A0A936YJ57_9HYPH|nr:hypothetical protein [Rhizobium setariae]MBL0370563.1 hypothetical protein [Rhizobium setariae]